MVNASGGADPPTEYRRNTDVIPTCGIVLDPPQNMELTLASRDNMGFRMLLGREAIRRRFFVDAGKSYYGGKPKRKKKSSKIFLSGQSIPKEKKKK